MHVSLLGHVGDSSVCRCVCLCRGPHLASPVASFSLLQYAFIIVFTYPCCSCDGFCQELFIRRRWMSQ